MNSSNGSLHRRDFLRLGGMATATVLAGRSLAARQRHPAFSDHPFQLGVASGDPSPDGFVLWTRLAPRPLEGGGMRGEPMEVTWEVAEDERFRRVVRRGSTIAIASLAHSVHVEVGGLRPSRWYWYRFHSGGETSVSGRTRTTPARGETVERFRFAFASCQHFESGYFTAYQHMLAEDVDLVVHLGDYIYEGPGVAGRVRKHLGPEIKTLSQYRDRYALYRLDPALQAMHAAAPWCLTWDDHEVDNNYAGAISEEKNVSPAELLRRRAAAYQAYYEHMPLRRAQSPRGPNLLLHRRIQWGQLARFHILDTRQYRTDQPCDDGNKPPCPDSFRPDATLLGRRQREWLFNGLSTPGTEWNILAQQVMMARVDRKAGPEEAFSMDQWPGYEFERRMLLRRLHEAAVPNPVVLTGDIHTNWANHLGWDPDRPDESNVAVELVGTSISSGGDGQRSPDYLPSLLRENPFVKFHSAERGYVRCDVSPKAWRADFRAVPFVTRHGAPCETRAGFVIESGRPILNPV